eukprot:1599298-Prymnesium_polylepis.1
MGSVCSRWASTHHGAALNRLGSAKSICSEVQATHDEREAPTDAAARAVPADELESQTSVVSPSPITHQLDADPLILRTLRVGTKPSKLSAQDRQAAWRRFIHFGQNPKVWCVLGLNEPPSAPRCRARALAQSRGGTAIQNGSPWAGGFLLSQEHTHAAIDHVSEGLS